MGIIKGVKKTITRIRDGENPKDVLKGNLRKNLEYAGRVYTKSKRDSAARMLKDYRKDKNPVSKFFAELFKAQSELPDDIKNTIVRLKITRLILDKKNKVIGRTIKMNDEHHTQKREYDIISPEGALICTVTNIYNKQGLKDYKFKLGDPTIKVPSNMFNNEWKKRFFNMANRRFNKTAMSKGTKAKNAEKQAQNNALFNFLNSFQKD